jgi:hypothetical protein
MNRLIASLTSALMLLLGVSANANTPTLRVTQEQVTALTGMAVSDTQVLLESPSERPLVSFTFTARGAALLHARMLGSGTA